MFTACGGGGGGGGDTPPPEPEDKATVIAGTYTGELKVTAGSTSNPGQGSDAVITRTADNKIKFELKSFKVVVPAPRSIYIIEDKEYIIGNISVADIDVAASGENVAINNKTFEKVSVTVNGSPSTVNVTVSEGKVVDKTLTIKVAFQQDVLGNVTAAFSGTKK